MRRRGVVGTLVSVLALSLLPAAPAAAQSSGSATVALDPNCGTPGSRTTVKVTGAGWVSGYTVTIYFEGNQVGADAADTSGRIDTEVILPARAEGYYRVDARNGYPNFQSASATFRLPCGLAPRMVLDPPCAPRTNSALRIDVYDFPETDGEARARFDPGGGDEVVNESPEFNEDGSITFFMKISPSSNKSYRVTVDDYGSYGITARGTYEVPCPPPTTTTTSATTTTTPGQTTTTAATTTTTTTTIPPNTAGAELVVDPPLGRAGSVTSARGSGFPPGPVTLSWSPGIGTTSAVAGDDGTFQTQVLILPNDRLGPRTLVASGEDTTASTAYLVVPSTMKPAGRDVAQIVRLNRYLHR